MSEDEVTTPAIAFLCAIGICLFLLVLFFLYMNKVLCFKYCRQCACLGSQVYVKHSDYGSTSKVDDSSSDSGDEDVQERYKEAVKRSASFLVHDKNEDVERGREADHLVNGEADVSLLHSKARETSQTHSSDDSGRLTADNELSKQQMDLYFDNKAYDTSDHAAKGSVPTKSDSDQGIEVKSADDALFDISDLDDGSMISKCGSINVSFLYSSATSIVTVSVHFAKGVPAKDRGGTDSSQVRLMLLPHKKQKFKTRIKNGCSPVFEEVFSFTNVKLNDLNNTGLRIRLYGVERMRRERLIGESIFAFNSLVLGQSMRQWLNLEPRSNLSSADVDTHSIQSDGGSSQQSLQHGGMPELLTGLTYTSTTGRLSCEIIKGSNFKNMAMTRPPDTYVKLTMMSATGHELYHSKTSVRRGQPNPLFKEMFMFQIAKFQLNEVTLLVSVYNKRSMKKKEMIGWFSLGRNSSGEEEQGHWREMCENQGQQICHWHILLES